MYRQARNRSTDRKPMNRLINTVSLSFSLRSLHISSNNFHYEGYTLARPIKFCLQQNNLVANHVQPIRNLFRRQFHFYLFFKTGNPDRYRHGNKKFTAFVQCKGSVRDFARMGFTKDFVLILKRFLF